MKQLPVIILNWNGTDDTIECLKSLENQTSKDFHIHLIDNNSDRNEQDSLECYIKNINNLSYYKEHSNLGFAGAHNKIFETVFIGGDFDYVFLLNNDTIVEANFIESVFNAIKNNPEAGMISSKMINYYKRELVNNLGHKFLNTGEVLPIACDRPHLNYQKTFFNAGASGGAALYSIEMLRKIGTFDPYFVTGYEDAELGIRAMVCGYELLYDPDIVVYHKVGASIDKVRDFDFTLKIQLDILYTYFKLMPIGVVVCNAPFYIVRSFVLLTLFLFTFRFKYFSIFIKGWNEFLKRDYILARENHKKLEPLIKLQWYKILRKQEFFLFDNIKRFWIYFIKGNKTIFEVYKDDK